MKRLLILLPALLLLGGCAGQKQGKLQWVEKQEGPAGDPGFAKEIEWPLKKRSIESISANTGAAMSSYPTASSVVAGDKALISKSTASNATQQAAMSTIKDYVLSDVIDFSATSPLNFNSTTGVLSLTPWASQSALETWLGWTFSGSGGGITVSSTLPTTTGSAALNDSTHVLTVASDTGYTQFTGSFTAWDTTPAAFGFGTITDAVAGQEYCWTTPATVADINRPATVSSTADSYKINGTTSTATSIALGDTFTPCMIASNTAGATVSGNMTIGGVVGSPQFSLTTSGWLETFDAAGYDKIWTTISGSPNADYSITPLVGAQSLFLANGAAILSPALSSDITETRFVFKKTSASSTETFISSYRASDGSSGVAVLSIVDGEIRVTCGADGSIKGTTSGLGMSAGNQYIIWFRYIKGTGSNSIVSARVATDTDNDGYEPRPSSANIALTTGKATLAARYVRIANIGGDAGNALFDNVTVVE